MHEHVLRRYRNAHMHVAKMAGYLQAYALSSYAWHADQVKAELEKIKSIEEVKVRRLRVWGHMGPILRSEKG